MKRVIVVGGGVGGLHASSRLAREGYSVRVLEKNASVGGRCSSKTLVGRFRNEDGAGDVDKAEYRFDTGPSLLLFPETYREAFASINAELPELLAVEPTAYRVWFEDGQRLDLLTGEKSEDKMAAQLEEVEAGAGDAYRKMIRSARTSLSVGVDAFIDRNFESLGDFLDPVRLVSLLPKLFQGGVFNPLSLLMPLDDWLRTYFKDPRIRALFTFQTLYVGLTPFNAPSAFSLLAATELEDGVWYPKGGFGKITKGLEKAARDSGVEIDCGKSVDQLELYEKEEGSLQHQHAQKCSRHCRGVVLNGGESVASDAVLVNADLPYAKKTLFGQQQQTSRSWMAQLGSKIGRYLDVKKDLSYSAGIVEFCWGVRAELEGLVQHNIFLSEEWEDSWKRPGTGGKKEGLPRTGNFYVHIPSKTDPSAVTDPGTHSVMVLFPVANMSELTWASSSLDATSNYDYNDLSTWCRSVILSRLKSSGYDIEEKIECETVTTPENWQDLHNLDQGAAFGLDHGLDQLGYFRPQNKDPDISQLYYVGASTHPGNGVPLVLTGSKLVCERILQDLKD